MFAVSCCVCVCLYIRACVCKCARVLPSKLGVRQVVILVIREATLLAYVQEVDLCMWYYRVFGCRDSSLDSEDCAECWRKSAVFGPVLPYIVCMCGYTCVCIMTCMFLWTVYIFMRSMYLLHNVYPNIVLAGSAVKDQEYLQ